MSTIVLDLTKPGAYGVEDFNDGERLAVVTDIVEAIDEAAFTAEAREAVVRVRVRAAGSTLEINTYPTALRLKVRFLQVALHVIGFVARALDFPAPASADAVVPTTPATYDLVEAASPQSIAPGQLVATPLRLATDRVRGSWADLVAEVNAALARHGLGVAAGGTDSPDGLPVSLSLNDNFRAGFVDHPGDLPESLYQIMEVVPTERHWASAVVLACSLPNVPGDDDANAIVFWTRS